MVSGTASGALAGLITGIAAAPLGAVPAGVILAIVAVGVVLDGCNLALGWPAPITSGRQVPREWGRIFDPKLVAVLYGTRLGVGPLTILTTWTWWSVTAAAALVSPGVAFVVGASFGFVRLLTTLAVSAWSGSGSVPAEMRSEDHALLFRRLRAKRRPNWIAINGIGLAAVVAMALTGCVDQRAKPAVLAPPSSEGGVSDGASTDSNSLAEPQPIAPDLVLSETGPSETGTPETGLSGTERPEVFTTVELEDVVRSPGVELDAANETDAVSGGVVAVSSSPGALERSLLQTIDGFEQVATSDADRHLDLTAASNLQPDPSEEIALLETRGFAGGWTRAFRNADNDVAVVSVYHFEDAAEAEFYLEDGLITIGGYGGKFFDLEDQPVSAVSSSTSTRPKTVNAKSWCRWGHRFKWAPAGTSSTSLAQSKRLRPAC